MELIDIVTNAFYPVFTLLNTVITALNITIGGVQLTLAGLISVMLLIHVSKFLNCLLSA